MELLADFLLFHLNRQGAECQAAYCRRYGVGEPIDDIVPVLVGATIQRQLYSCWSSWTPGLSYMCVPIADSMF
jgi:hypothetical protein